MKRHVPETTQLLTVRELADYRKIRQGKTYRMLKAGQLPGFRAGFDWRFNRDDIDRWLTEREKKVKRRVFPLRDFPRKQLTPLPKDLRF